MSKFGFLSNIFDKHSLTFSPPDKSQTLLLISSSPNKNLPSRFLTSVFVYVGNSSEKSSNTVFTELFSAILWSKYSNSISCPYSYSPEIFEITPTIVFINVDLPVPFAPRTASLSCLLTITFTVAIAFSYPTTKLLQRSTSLPPATRGTIFT